MIKLSPFAWLIASFIGYFAAYGVFLPFLPVWLQSQHYSDEMIGLIAASAFLFRFIGSMVFSQWIKLPSHLIPTLRAIGYVSLLLTVGMIFSAHSAWLLFIFIALFNVVYGAGVPLTDSLAGTWQQQVPLDYGKARLTGSLSFIAANLLAGYVLALWGDENTLWLMSVLLLVYIIAQHATPTVVPQNPTDDEQAHEEASYKRIFTNRPLVALLAVLALIQGAHGAYYAYGVLYWAQQGISVELTGWLWGISVAAEVMLFFFASRLFKATSLTALLTVSALFSVIRWAGMAYVDGFFAFLLLQCLHAFTFAICHFATVRYISAQPSRLIPKLQALYSGVCSCLSVALLMLLAGGLYNSNPAWAFMAMALAIVPTFPLLAYIKRHLV
ncbi:3-phenylpropionate MFS transporter [Spirabiliibacterium falconis]|uniref:3-phenylpropionate MFS transporter n=1 Tax=Spirabiliibacterium falconis TaxID=572023 RepID=UPI001AAD9DCD|nr:3-phenylpropionate MFS transporter [Spirabiliibacterium falconis]MBE2895088.1 3-phenylpropionate MFS transporter [Spirabiliibacterium falconis]